MKLNNTILFIPINYNLIVLSKKNKNFLKIYNNVFKLNFRIFKKIKINKKLNFIEFENKKLFKNNFLIKNYFYTFLNHLYKNCFLKIKFKGKGYKIGFYKKKLAFFFGKSHHSIFIYKNIKIKKIIKNKYKFLLICNNYNLLRFFGFKTINTKKINFFTLRGLRISRQLLIKRKGRKGGFI